MKTTTKTAANPPVRLTLAAPVLKRLAQAGIYCMPEIAMVFHRGKSQHLLRARESGGAIRQFGRYVAFCAESGERLQYLLRPDSLMPNGEHAVIVAPSLIAVEMFRVGSTYDLLICRHAITPTENGARPQSRSRILFRASQGQLPVDLTKAGPELAGHISPEFLTEAGEPKPVPARYQEIVRAVTHAVNCVNCRHSHYSDAPAATTAEMTATEELSTAAAVGS